MAAQLDVILDDIRSFQSGFNYRLFMAGKYFIKLDQFEGPLDLLLHLIKMHELDIFNIDLFILTTQYLGYLRVMNYRDLGDASAFMSMSATLIEIKSSQLLPSEKGKELNADELEDEEDPAAQLQRRLLEYDAIRKSAQYLMDIPSEREVIAYSSEWHRIAHLYDHIEAPLRGDSFTLPILYEQMLGQLLERKPAKVKAVTESITVEQIIDEMKKTVKSQKILSFSKIIKSIESRYELVAYILALLQLVRDRDIKIYQEEHFSSIWFYPYKYDESDILEEIGSERLNDSPSNKETASSRSDSENETRM